MGTAGIFIFFIYDDFFIVVWMIKSPMSIIVFVEPTHIRTIITIIERFTTVVPPDTSLKFLILDGISCIS